jgi:hypothetical protein
MPHVRLRRVPQTARGGLLGTKERGEQVAVVISLTELGYPKPTWDDAKKLAATLNREAAFIVLAQTNLFLSVASIQSHQHRDLNIRRYAQERVIANFISEVRLAEIRNKVGNADLIDRILVHRSLAMAALRLVAIHGRTEGGNKLESRADYDALGELALIINSVTEPDAAHLTACDIAAQISPSRELENHPDLGLALVRIERMLDAHLSRRASSGSASEIAKRAERVFTFETNGFNFQSFRDLTFAMFAYYSSLDLTAVLRDQSITYLNPKYSSKVVKAELLDTFLVLQALDFADVPAFLAKGAADDRLLSDFTAFRQKPFWRFPNGAYLCVDPAFLMDKLAEGTYWWVMDGLGPRDDTASDEHREQFASLWGYIFEDYVDEQLAYAHAGSEDSFVPHPYYVKPGEEAFDQIVLVGTDVVVSQCKGAFLPIEARYSGRCKPFLAGLNKRFGSDPSAACEQLLRNLQLSFGINGERREIRGVPTDGIRTVYPLAIVQEPLLGFWLAAKLLVDDFVTQVDQVRWKLDLKVRPVVFMTIEELETIAAYINARDFTMVEFLREKLGTDREHKLSVEQFLKRFFLESRGLSWRRNEFMATSLEETKKQWNGRWESGMYL